MAHNVMGNKTLSEKTAEKICQYIEERELNAGDKLPNEFQLAEICGVGRSTVREAIKLLTFEGRLEVVRGSGTFILDQRQETVPSLPDDDPMGLQEGEGSLAKRALEFFDVRLMLEPEIAALAAANATYKDCQKLQEIHKELVACVKNHQNHLQEDTRFHAQVAACTHNKVVQRLMEIVVTGIPIFIEVTGNRYAEDTAIQHRIIIEAIMDGDTTGARYAMITHLNSNRKMILDLLAEEKSRS